MPNGCASQKVSLTLQEGAYLEYLPDAIIPFRDARFSQETVITVARGATLVYGEIMSPGRVEMGESFAYTQWRNRLTVMAPDGGPLYREAYTLAPRKQSPLGIGVMGRFTAPSLGTLLLINNSFNLEKLRDGVRDRVAKLPPEQASTASVGVSLLPHDIGVGLKVVGEPTSAIAKVIRAAWAEGRRQLLGVGLPPLRKY